MINEDVLAFRHDYRDAFDVVSNFTGIYSYKKKTFIQNCFYFLNPMVMNFIFRLMIEFKIEAIYLIDTVCIV